MQHLRAVPGYLFPVDEPAVGVDRGQVDDPLDGPFDNVAAEHLREDATLAPEPRHPGVQGAAVQLDRLERPQDAIEPREQKQMVG